MNIKITGSGSYIPTEIVTNLDFAKHIFLNDDGTPFPLPNETITEKFYDITGIEERRYVTNDLLTSDIGAIAAKRAIEDAGIDPETLDYIIFAHNFGNVKHAAIQTDILPSLATRVKHNLRIKNPKCVAYDMLFGCPGWIEGIIQAKAFIQAGMAKKCLVIGAETLSRVVDLHDRDSMIYSDGAGATIIESSEDEGGILAYESASFTYDEAYYLHFGNSFNKSHNPDVRYIKMHGRKIYEFALNNVPKAMKECLDKSGISINEVKKVLIHQANEKMDEAIIQRFYKQYKQTPPEGIMPMCIHKLGNSSVATIPTLFNLIIKGEIKNQQINKGDVIIFASVGAGMNINAIVYRY
ncbi:ketoacyl-ACP synthase III [Flavobacterium columnare]|uniref:3-oxoacyl-[acyl-carrier-protein] synthase III n=2 Tax=Flavobacterium columnare TaxID=996 RepID=G8X797_FLACA|nr:ketoacyl-ACP synthase III [Flavobacterium columnare]AEW87082.1 3-oxoacyl-[acyl-carrier-protein] synthase III [Flavobacterium columnare ATCC 49512]AMO21045.1 ketoacyl-ACP synthase III [Flavobacterium columnare]ANO47590.1 3-oxoacyl-[acyl-carrier-protein] synthase III [Flavobacterium columnare]APT21782.1 ketoacyl-ACP synthase III [Flavobacterium columnare]AUX19045.1 3-oxoacyl-ACP synthase [Flavobacterium columnare]